jgi:hypothetical protein
VRKRGEVELMREDIQGLKFCGGIIRVALGAVGRFR